MTTTKPGAPRVLFLSGLQIHPTLLGGEPAQLRPGHRAPAARPRRLRVLPGRAQGGLPRAPSVVESRPGRTASRSTSIAGRSGSSPSSAATALGLPPVWITAYLRAAAAVAGGDPAAGPLREKLAWCDVIVADFPFVHPIFSAPSARGRLRVLSTHNLEHQLCDGQADGGHLRCASVARGRARGRRGLRRPGELLRRRPRSSSRRRRSVRQSVLVPNGIDLRALPRHGDARAKGRAGSWGSPTT